MFIKCSDINFQYPGSTKYILKNLTFEMKEPGFNALFGPSGVGKTSFARMLTKELNNYSGTIETGGMDTILYSYNLERLPGWSSVGKHLIKITPPGEESKKDNLIEIFGLSEVMESRFAQLSMGQQNRINLIRYLLQDFDLLIMDESLANVDEKSRERIILKIKSMFPNKMFLYISHNLMEVSKFCRDILVFSAPEKRDQTRVVTGEDYCNGTWSEIETENSG